MSEKESKGKIRSLWVWWSVSYKGLLMEERGERSVKESNVRLMVKYDRKDMRWRGVVNGGGI